MNDFFQLDQAVKETTDKYKNINLFSIQKLHEQSYGIGLQN